MARKIKYLNKRENIIEAARKLFNQYGYEKVTIDQIAKVAGMGKGTIYTEFKNKQDIMHPVVCQFVDDVDQKIREFINKSKDTAINILRETQLQRILLHYDQAKSNFQGTELFAISLDKIKNCDQMHLESDKITAQLLEYAAKNKEIAELDDYLKTAIRIRKALISFYPPLVFSINDRESVIREANRLLCILLAGLTVGLKTQVQKG